MKQKQNRNQLLNLKTKLKPLLIGLVSLLCALSSTYSIAAESAFSIDVSRITIDNDIDPEVNPVGLRGRLSTQVHRYFDVSGHAGFSFSESLAGFDDLVLTYASAFIKGVVPVGKRSAIYGLAGFTVASFTEDFGRRSSSSRFFREDRSGFSWGFGAETRIAENIDVTADFVSYLQRDGLFEEISAISIGLKFYYY